MKKRQAWYEVAVDMKTSQHHTDMLESRWYSNDPDVLAAKFQAISDEEAVTEARSVVEGWRKGCKELQDKDNCYRLDYMRFKHLHEVEKVLNVKIEIILPEDFTKNSRTKQISQETQYIKIREVPV